MGPHLDLVKVLFTPAPIAADVCLQLIFAVRPPDLRETISGFIGRTREGGGLCEWLPQRCILPRTGTRLIREPRAASTYPSRIETLGLALVSHPG